MDFENQKLKHFVTLQQVSLDYYSEEANEFQEKVKQKFPNEAVFAIANGWYVLCGHIHLFFEQLTIQDLKIWWILNTSFN